MSARSRAIQEALGLARDAILFGRSHVAVLADREILGQLPDMLATKLRDEIDAVTVHLAGQQESVADCLAAAIRGARRAGGAVGSDDPERSRLALLVPDALAIPASSLRSLHELASRMGAHRLVLLVDRQTRHVDNPVMEVVARLGAAVLTVQVDLPELEPVVVPTLEELMGEGAEPTSPAAPAPAMPPAAESESPGGSDRVDLPEPAPPVQAPVVAEAPVGPEGAAVGDAPPRPAAPPGGAGRRGLWLQAITAVGVAAVAIGVAAFVAAPGVVHQLRAAVDVEGLLSRSASRNSPPAGLAASIEEEIAPAEPDSSPSIPSPSADAEAGSGLATSPAEPPGSSAAAVPAALPATAAAASAARETSPSPSPRPVPRPVARAESKPSPPAKARSAAKSRPPPRPPRAVAPGPTLRVNFNAVPWADLVIDGKRLGPTPLAGVPLSTGTHQVHATFPDGRVIRREIRVETGRTRFRIE